MKRILITILAGLLLFCFGCKSEKEVGNLDDFLIDTESEIIVPETPVPPQENLPELDGAEDEVYEEEKKKLYAVSRVNGLRVRKGQNSSSSVIGYLDKGDAVFILSESGNYYKTIYKEQEAFVYSSYCDVMEMDYQDSKVEGAIDLASSLLGYPYVWGSQRYHWGNGKLNKNFVNGEFDCSALVQYVYFISNNVILDVTSRSQVNNGKGVEKSNLKRGDLMFFTNASRKNKTGNERIGHVGIYFGNNYILHTASDHAVIEPISDLRWSYYITARRVV